MNPTSEEISAHYFKTEEEELLFNQIGELQHEIIMREIQIEDLEKEVAHWKSNYDNQVKLKSQLIDRQDLKDRAASIQKLQERIAELEAWNKMLTETGHWIGQEEAFDLKMEVEEFLASMRWENAWTASSESINRLRSALNNCGEFKSYSSSRGLEKQP